MDGCDIVDGGGGDGVEGEADGRFQKKCASLKVVYFLILKSRMYYLTSALLPLMVTIDAAEANPCRLNDVSTGRATFANARQARRASRLPGCLRCVCNP